MLVSCMASWLAACLPACFRCFDLPFSYISLSLDIQGEGSPDQVSWEKLDFIPEEYMGHVIGKRREHLDKIEQKTGATLKVRERNSLCIKGSPESQKRAIREIKEVVVSLAMEESVQQVDRADP